MRIRITHSTSVHYSGTVTDGVMLSRLGPLSDADQRWDRFDLHVTPRARVVTFVDGFGNTTRLVTVAQPHETLEMVARSEVTTTLTDPFALPEVRPRTLSHSERFDGLAPSRLVPLVPELRDLADPYRPSTPDGTFESAHELMTFVYGSFAYQQQTTTVATAVPELLRTRTGVCQDFAHVLLGLCRSLEIPARYVSGYLVLDDPREASARDRSVAAASHAWVEAYTPTHGWRGFDPTNNLVVSEHHVKMAIGRDYGDVPPTRGTSRSSTRGSASDGVRVSVTTERMS